MPRPVSICCKRIEAEIDTVKTCLDKHIERAIKQHAVCGQHDRFYSIHRFRIPHKIDNIIPKQGLPPCKTNLPDAGTAENLNYPAYLPIMKLFNRNIGPPIPLTHTADTAQIAPRRYRNTHIINMPVITINQYRFFFSGFTHAKPPGHVQDNR